jgi:hypothetical protein
MRRSLVQFRDPYDPRVIQDHAEFDDYQWIIDLINSVSHRLTTGERGRT